MELKRAREILVQQREYWDYDKHDCEKRPLAVLRKDLVDAINIALLYIPKED